MQVHANENRKWMTVMVRVKKGKKAKLSSMPKAIAKRQLISELAAEFETLNMHLVARHLEAAYREIDRIWEESDFTLSA